jgi:DNA-binding transcriptional ArsR family regulator
LSLPVAARGENGDLRELWEAREFDFEDACCEVGRNRAFWVLCYRRHLRGMPLPDLLERRRICRRANAATGYLDRQGKPERYTLWESTQTAQQVEGYPSAGLRVLTARVRHWASSSRSRLATPPVRRLAVALSEVAEMSGRMDFSCSTRRLGEMAGMSHVAVSTHMHALVSAGLVRRKGYCEPRGGYERGTSRFTIMPRRPEQRVDEQEPPVFDPARGAWTWRNPSDRGRITRWIFQRMIGSVPNVNETEGATRRSGSVGSFQVAVETSGSRGSP